MNSYIRWNSFCIYVKKENIVENLNGTKCSYTQLQSEQSKTFHTNSMQQLLYISHNLFRYFSMIKFNFIYKIKKFFKGFLKLTKIRDFFVAGSIPVVVIFFSKKFLNVTFHLHWAFEKFGN